MTHETREFNSAQIEADSAMMRRRQRILRAAELLFAERSYASVQMDEIAQAAQVAKPTLYRYFANKEQLFLAALDQTVREVTERAREAAAAAASRGDALVQVMSVATERLGGGVAALRALDGADPGLSQTIRKALRSATDDLRAIVAGLVREGMRSGEFRDVDPELASFLVLGAVRMGAVRAPVRRRAAMASTMGLMLLRGLNNGPSGRPDVQTRTPDEE